MHCAISVGAGKNQIPLIKGLTDKGYSVVAFDINKDAPGRQFCSDFKNISTHDYEKAIRWLNGLNYKFDGIGTFSYGVAIVTRERIAKFFNLPAQIPSVIVPCNENKITLREILYKNKLSNLKEWHSPLNTEYTLSQLTHKKYIIKPLVGGSGKNIKIIPPDKVINAIGSSYLVQEFLEGNEYRIHALIQEGLIQFCAVMRRENLEGTCILARLIPVINNFNWAKQLVKKIILKLGITHAALKIDVICADRKTEIIEIDFAPAGDYFESDIAPNCFFYNLIGNYINLITGKRVCKQADSGHLLYFDYVYNLGKKPFRVAYKRILPILKEVLGEVKIKKIKREGELVNFPKNNMSAILAVLHSRDEISNAQINEIIMHNA
jgi:predicted ATP-grasp superfamily ATP-dependent carboligase